MEEEASTAVRRAVAAGAMMAHSGLAFRSGGWGLVFVCVFGASRLSGV